mmetsp:Transcript_7336/g.23412  ORF Transcript_7336/g.23412 Transcript_7336/m.23412 type:complete len:395 (-) Transcript_7336:23-1207(-)
MVQRVAACHPDGVRVAGRARDWRGGGAHRLVADGGGRRRPARRARHPTACRRPNVLRRLRAAAPGVVRVQRRPCARWPGPPPEFDWARRSPARRAVLARVVRLGSRADPGHRLAHRGRAFWPSHVRARADARHHAARHHGTQAVRGPSHRAGRHHVPRAAAEDGVQHLHPGQGGTPAGIPGRPAAGCAHGLRGAGCAGRGRGCGTAQLGRREASAKGKHRRRLARLGDGRRHGRGHGRRDGRRHRRRVRGRHAHLLAAGRRALLRHGLSGRCGIRRVSQRFGGGRIRAGWGLRRRTGGGLRRRWLRRLRRCRPVRCHRVRRTWHRRVWSLDGRLRRRRRRGLLQRREQRPVHGLRLRRIRAARDQADCLRGCVTCRSDSKNSSRRSRGSGGWAG